MNAEFNKKLFLDNISHLIQENSMKVGELESETGVSTGYISRISKDNTSKPGIDFIIKTARAMKVSVDTLLSVNLASITPTEQYIIKFIEKLKLDTTNEKLDWIISSADSLNRMICNRDGSVDHPLFSYETFFEQGEAGYPEEVSSVVFTSHSFDCHTYINGDCFSLRLKNGAVLYIMNICKTAHRINDPDAYAKEMWIYKPHFGAQYLCSNKDDLPLDFLVDDLYTVIEEFSKHPRIRKELQASIDAFMHDDFEDDDDDEDIPF